jgi:hypothetical protein
LYASRGNNSIDILQKGDPMLKKAVIYEVFSAHLKGELGCWKILLGNDSVMNVPNMTVVGLIVYDSSTEMVSMLVFPTEFARERQKQSLQDTCDLAIKLLRKEKLTKADFADPALQF